MIRGIFRIRIKNIMRKFLTVLLALSFNVALAHPGHGGHSGNGGTLTPLALSTVTGTVTLLAGSSNFPSSLSAFYKGREKTVNTSETGKVIKVSGSYSDGETVDVVENGSHDASYTFNLPVISSVISGLTKKAQASSASVSATFSGVLSSTTSASSIISETNVNISKDFDASKITASRKGNKAIIKGSFTQKGSSAKGRFKLTFTE